MNIEQKRIVVVLGMHRSGTSAITRGLEVLGVELGDRLLQPEAGINDKGFWEDRDVTAFDVELLELLGHDWHTFGPLVEEEFQQERLAAMRLRAVELLRGKLTGGEVLGLKDPRMARLLPFWESVFSHLGLAATYVIAFRNPMNVAGSLMRRNGFPREKSYLLWLEHMVLALRHTQGAQRVVVDYDRMLAAPLAELARIAAAIDLPFDPLSEEAVTYGEEFLEESLRHNTHLLPDLRLDPTAPHEVVEFANLLAELATDIQTDDGALSDRVERVLAELSGWRPLYRYANRLDADNGLLRRDLAEREAGLAATNQALEETTQSLHEVTGALHGVTEDLHGTRAALNEKAQALQEATGNLHEVQAALHEKAQALELARQAKAELEQHAAALERVSADQSIAAERQLEAERSRGQELGLAMIELRSELALKSHALATARSGRAALRSLLRALAARMGLAWILIWRLRREVRRSGLFDADFYCREYPDVSAAGVDPLAHFLTQGWREGRNPAAPFSTRAYLARYADVRATDTNPLLHYLRHGYRERRLVPMPGGGAYLPVPRPGAGALLLGAVAAAVRRPELVGRFVAAARRGGLRHALEVMRARMQAPAAVAAPATAVLPIEEMDREAHYDVVPYYLNPFPKEQTAPPSLRTAIHLHLFYPDLAEACISYLNNIPVDFALYVSVSEAQDAAGWRRRLADAIPRATDIFVEPVPNRGRDVAPMIVQFGKHLADYDVVAHFHTKKSPHKKELSNWFQLLMTELCGSQESVSQILALLAKDAKVVFPAGNQLPSWDTSGWSNDGGMAAELLARYTELDIAHFPNVEFPQGNMFWARAECLRDFLTLPLSYDDFPEEPIPADGTLAHALERLVLVFAAHHRGRNYRLESPELSQEPLAYFEEQRDYSHEIVHDTVKVLAYYLPQFHPTPENDEWHGKGFTEWHKVRAAYPLFAGHYQQHVPHPDLGYYHLDSPATLALQAEMMRKAGVNGLIFYHYWFSGRMILEQPAQMLLATPDIDMPFCFCWANENWTRRWDGNEKEILLGQVYSPEDAAGFIRYLIPFFRDERHLKVEGRPLLFIYRPSAVEHVGDYLRIWREECELAGLPAPFVVATLTRGATSPAPYGMDAALERPLHDWTDGGVPDIRHELKPYWPLNGSFLDYGAVADHYMQKPMSDEFTLFRSLVATWDNTARYGSEAIGLHRFSPAKFQEWMEHLVHDATARLPADRRFVVVNAWNEWAEGAHLEPDLRFGYAYLNAVGRSLCGYAFDDTRYLASHLNKQLVIRVELGGSATEALSRGDEGAVRKFVHCLAVSTAFESCSVTVADEGLRRILAERGLECVAAEADYILRFEELNLFPRDCIETLLLTALRHPGFTISPSLLNDADHLHDPTAPNFEMGYKGRAAIELSSSGRPFRGYKIAPMAVCLRQVVTPADAPVPRVATVIRFHRNGDRRLLINALLSLLAQAGCQVQPWLAVQDIDGEGLLALQDELALLPWAEGCEPLIRSYRSSSSNPDLRSQMLNETLKTVGSGYAACLDYDDVLFPTAYQWLISRLQSTGANATFGRVYATVVDAQTGMIIRRDKTYVYGYSYAEFVGTNHAPLHSFMLNLDQIDFEAIRYFGDMKYMEDYYLTLQVFHPARTDWDSLKHCDFIGDYIHRIGCDGHTLAISNEQDRVNLLEQPDYMVCEDRIQALRASLKTGAKAVG